MNEYGEHLNIGVLGVLGVPHIVIYCIYCVFSKEHRNTFGFERCSKVFRAVA